MRKLSRCVLLLFALVVFSLYFAFSATKFEVTSPKDKTVTKANRAYIGGTAAGAKGLFANSAGINIENGGKFEAMALLRAGKNVLDVSAYFPSGAKETKRIRILRVVAFDDMEISYGGRPHWAKSQVTFLATLGIIEGYPDNSFGPEKPLLRGELATWLARAKGLNIFPAKADVFFDVPKEHWRAPYIKAVVKAGYMGAVSKNRFGIDNPVKRNEAVQIIARAYNIAPSKTKKSYFVDVTPRTKYSEYIDSEYSKGIVIGVYGKTRMFEPERDMNRAEAALLFSSLSNIKAQKAALYDFSKGYSASASCRIGTKPVIKKTAASPKEISADGKTPIKLSATVEDSQGRGDISQVWADLTPLGGPNNAKMTLVEGGNYELSFVMTSETKAGEKNITVKVLDKSGLGSENYIKFIVTRNK